MRFSQFGLILTLAAMALVTAAHAAPVVDQSHQPIVSSPIGFVQGGSTTIDRAQTFTAGVTGVLTDIEVIVGRATLSISDGLIWDVRTVIAGTPSDPDSGLNILASGTVAAADVPVTIDPSNFLSLGGMSVSVSTGDVLAIVLRSMSPESGAYRWKFSDNNDSVYAAGASFDRIFSPSWDSNTSPFDDAGFRTFVNAVPEPNGVLALVVLGVAIGATRRRVQRTH